MPTDEMTPTPADAGPGLDPTPASEPGDTQDADSTQSPQQDAPPVTLEELQAEIASLKTSHEREKIGRAGALRALESERRRADAALSIAQGAQRQPVYQQSAPIPPEHQIDETGLTAVELNALNDAVIAGDRRTIHDIEARRASRLRQAAASDAQNAVWSGLNSAAQVAGRNQSFLGWFHGHKLGDSQNPTTQKVAEQYNSMLNDPAYGFVDRTPFDMGGGVVVVPNLLVMAQKAVEAEHKDARSAATEAARQSPESFTEPPQRTGQMPGTTKPGTFSTKLLDQGERELIGDIKKRDPSYTAEKYFNNLPEENRKARLAAGKPVPTSGRRTSVSV